jgi:hypothetical protein
MDSCATHGDDILKYLMRRRVDGKRPVQVFVLRDYDPVIN